MSAFPDFATRLLAGTGLTTDTARSVAAGLTPTSAPAESALRDRWTATDRATLPTTLPIVYENGEPT